MDNLHILKGSVENLPTEDNIEVGALYFCTDSLEIYEGYLDTSVNPNMKKTRRYNSMKVLIETSGTTVLDSCTTEGDYVYISEGGARNRLTVASYTTTFIDEETSTEMIAHVATQVIVRLLEPTDTVNNVGIIYRLGTKLDGEDVDFVWDEEKCLTAQTPSFDQQVLMGNSDGSVYWSPGRLVPDHSLVTGKSVLTTDGVFLGWKPAPTATEVALSTGGWNPETDITTENGTVILNHAQYTSVYQLYPDDIVIVSSEDSNYNLYGIKCAYQVAGGLYFTCEPIDGSYPTSNIVVKVVRM